MAEFLARVIREYVAAGFRLVHLILDNASANTAALKETPNGDGAGTPGGALDPTHASWLNLADPFWSSFHRAVIATSHFDTHAAVEATEAHAVYWQAHPRECHWPKQPRRKRASAPLPAWRRLLLVPINSRTLN